LNLGSKEGAGRSRKEQEGVKIFYA